MTKVDTVYGMERRFEFFKGASIIAFCITIIFLFATTETFAKDYSFTWSANTDPVEGYKLYYKKGGDPVAPFNSTGAIQGTSPITIGKQSTFTISGLDENATYYFALTAYNGSEESGYSDIITVNGTGTTPPSTSIPLAAIITTTSQTGVAPFNLTFNGSQSTGSISSYAWSFGDGGTATGPIVSHSYQNAGTFTATLVVADASGLTKQSSVAITVTAAPKPPAYTPPTVVLSSSSAVGVAPFTVQFDGSGSSGAQPPIVSHTWDFGDGTSAEGAVVAHTFTVAGTYHIALTVTDSVGLTSTTSTPVLISAPPVQDNKPPVASFTATPTSGKTPLNVSFNASGSSDPDGSISNYVWSFGDGSSASGVSTQHTFTDIADYTVSLQVTDDKGATAASSQTISVLAEDEVIFDFELQEVQADHTWKTVTFSKQFINPVVVAGPPSFAEAQPATLRIRNVTPTGCEIRVQEWDYLDDIHATETFVLFVMEKGVFALDNGAKVEAGTFTGSTAFQNVSLQQPYTLVPVIFTQVMTENDSDAVTGRLRNSNKSTFEYKMQEQDRNRISHKAETIGYIAWEPGKGEYAGLLYESGFTTTAVTHNWFDLTFQSAFADLPLFIAGMQTSVEADAAALRSQNISATTVQIKVEEEKSKDTEISHAGEVVGYLAIGNLPKPPSSDKKFTFTWDYGETQNIGGFRFYLNNTQLCETTNPGDRQLACNAPLLNETMAFTMTAVFLDGSESTPANVLSISPADFPELFGIKLATFTWDFDNTKESSISGFRIYNYDTLVCESNNPAERQKTCDVQIGISENVFTIKALGIDGTETAVSNTLNYTP